MNGLEITINGQVKLGILFEENILFDTLLDDNLPTNILNSQFRIQRLTLNEKAMFAIPNWSNPGEPLANVCYYLGNCKAMREGDHFLSNLMEPPDIKNFGMNRRFLGNVFIAHTVKIETHRKQLYKNWTLIEH